MSPFASKDSPEVIVSPELFLTAGIVGVISGLICVLVRLGLRFLQWAITSYSGTVADAASHLPFWRRVITPILGAVLATLIVKVARDWLHVGRSVDYVEAVHFHGGRIPFRATLFRTISSAFSIASGAAIGREGSMIQFATASISALGGAMSRRTVPLERLVALSTAAAVASVYQAPLAGIFFALEIVLKLRAVSKPALRQVPALAIAAGCGAYMSHLLLGSGPLFPVAAPLQFRWQESVPILIGAVAIGSLGPVYFRIVESLRFMKKLPWAMVWSGVIVGLLSCLRPEVWGNGENGVLQVIRGSTSLQAAAILLALRLTATAACVGSGVVGGVFTPTIFAGSVLGLIFGGVTRSFFGNALPPVEYAVVGVVCLLASVTHAPFMAALMTTELTGEFHWLPITFLCSLIAFQVGRMISHDSLYAVASTDPGKVGQIAPEQVAAQ